MSSSVTEPLLLFRGELPDGRQVLVTVWDRDAAEVAFRSGTGATWGRPTPLSKAE